MRWRRELSCGAGALPVWSRGGKRGCQLPVTREARAVCEAMDVELTPSNINNARLKLKRLVERRILVETEQGLFTRPRP